MRASLLTLVLLVLLSTPAAAFDPDARRGARDDQPDQAAEAARLGLHRVTEVFAGERVTHSGDLTTYSTDTVHRPLETFARAIATVGTGQRSALDGAAFNGRGTLSTGEPLAGTFFEDFMWNGRRFAPVNIVFFQDDSELGRFGARAPVPASRPDAAMVVHDGAAAPALLQPPTSSSGAAPTTEGVPPPPLPRDMLEHDAARAPRVQIGIDPTGGEALRDALEVARGRRYSLTVNTRGAPAVALEAWQLVDGVNDAWNALGWHTAQEHLIGTWLRLPPPGAAWTLMLRVRVRPVAGGRSFELQAPITIAVRSPAVVE